MIVVGAAAVRVAVVQAVQHFAVVLAQEESVDLALRVLHLKLAVWSLGNIHRIEQLNQKGFYRQNM